MCKSPDFALRALMLPALSAFLVAAAAAQDAAPAASSPVAAPEKPADPTQTANSPAPPAAPATAPPAPAGAGAAPAASEQVIEPQVERRDLKVPHIPSNDIELGVFGGTYETQNFGASPVGGLRAGYDITEDVFVQAVAGQTRVTDQDFRLILPGGIFPSPYQTLRYYDLTVGYNVLPGEVFPWRNHAKVSAFYLAAGIGTTKFDGASHETFNVGAGYRVFLADWTAVQLDVRDHIFSLNLLGAPQTTQNLELTLGWSFFF
jgi:outer membrane beta-barrel protein